MDIRQCYSQLLISIAHTCRDDSHSQRLGKHGDLRALLSGLTCETVKLLERGGEIILRRARLHYGCANDVLS